MITIGSYKSGLVNKEFSQILEVQTEKELFKEKQKPKLKGLDIFGTKHRLDEYGDVHIYKKN